jgi:membrane protease YdiL (CAAX protease family)
MAVPLDVFAVRRMPIVVVGLALVLHVALSTLVNFRLFDADWMRTIARVSDGWLSGTLVANLLLIAVVAGGCLGCLGGARPADLGLRWRDLWPGLLATLAMWVTLHAVAVVVAMASGGGLVSGPAWSHPQREAITLVGQLFGNAFYEELLFRGCLLVQVGHWLHRGEGRPARRTVALAILLSALVFALQHAPNRLAGHQGSAWQDLPSAATDLGLLFFSGVVFAGVFVRTGNLFVAIGLHALGNVPMLLLAAPDWVHPATLVAAMLCLLGFGPRWFARGLADR